MIHQSLKTSADETGTPATFNPFTFIKADKFFPAYAPTVKARKHKLAGLRKLTEADREAIRSGMDKLIEDLKKAVIGLVVAFSVM